MFKKTFSRDNLFVRADSWRDCPLNLYGAFYLMLHFFTDGYHNYTWYDLYYLHDMTKLPPNGHIFVDSPSIRRGSSTWKSRRNYIHLKGQSTWKLWHQFNVDSTFKINVISTSSSRGIVYVVSTSNRRNFCTRCLHCIIS